MPDRVLCVVPGAACLIHARQPRTSRGGCRFPDGGTGVLSDAFPVWDVPGVMARCIGVLTGSCECVRTLSVKED
jgi:hypothetical protein